MKKSYMLLCCFLGIFGSLSAADGEKQSKEQSSSKDTSANETRDRSVLESVLDSYERTLEISDWHTGMHDGGAQ